MEDVYDSAQACQVPRALSGDKRGWSGGGDWENGRWGIHLSGTRGDQDGLVPVTRVKRMEEESQAGNQGARVYTLPLTAEQC